MPTDAVEFRLLGPVQLWVDGAPVDLGPAKQRTVLAALLMDAGRPVGTGALIERVWGEDAPAGARSGLYSYLTRLRRVLDAAAVPVELAFGPGGYVAKLEPDLVDAHRFRRLVEQARQDDDHEGRAARLDAAVALWRGPALADLIGDWVARARDALAQSRIDAVILWANAELRLGRTETVIGPLRTMWAEHPLVEPLAARLIEALCHQQRVAEALDCYAVTRRRLVEELGTEPGAELRLLHQRMLADNDEPAPAQLPLDVHGFTGRRNELNELDAMLDLAGGQPSAVVISTLLGTAGVGKTALAVHWAHRVAARFPDGQLYVNLRGFGPTGSAMAPDEAVRGFLDGLGVPKQRIPSTLDSQVGRYRSLLAGKRMLVVLDNAATADQVRPLLPGSPGCLVVVTSRTQLTSLVVIDGAHPVTLDVLSAAEARRLLAHRLGAARVDAEPDAVTELVARCARLPLALTIVAARAATYPGQRLADLATELRETRTGLDSFASTDSTIDMRAVFSWSYRTLSSGAARLFRLLGLHPGPDCGVAAAAALAGVSPARNQPQLNELVAAHLLQQPVPGRYACHDLLRAYASELAEATEAKADVAAARLRLLDHYLHTAHSAARLLNPHGDPIPLPEPVAGARPQPITDHPAAMSWCTAEHRTLIASIRLAAATGFDAHIGSLARVLIPFLDLRGHWRDLADTQRAALAAAGRLGDPATEARAHSGLARASTYLGSYEDGAAHYRAALGLFGTLGDRYSEAHMHFNLAWALTTKGDYTEAAAHAQHALDRYRTVHNRLGEARALNMIGWVATLAGEHIEAIARCREALTLAIELEDRTVEANSWDSLGVAHHQLGDHGLAIACYRRAVGLYHGQGDRYSETDSLTHLGDAYASAANTRRAHQAWRDALAILDELDHPDADRLRVKLGLPTES